MELALEIVIILFCIQNEIFFLIRKNSVYLVSKLVFSSHAELMEFLSNQYSFSVSWCMCSERGTQGSSQLQQDTVEATSDDVEKKH